jgi:hypothetical protein
MATHDISILGGLTVPDSTISFGKVGDFATSIAASPGIGDVMCYVLVDGAADSHISGTFNVPQNYSGTPVITIKGFLDGAPGAGDDLGFGFQGLGRVDNEAGDTAYSTADLAGSTDIGSTGSAHSDEDLYVETITLSNFTPVAGDQVTYDFFLDISATTYTGNFLLTTLQFTYADA